MKNSEIRELASGDIADKIIVEKDTLLRLKINHAVTPSEKPQEFQLIRKNIARLMTELRRREIENK